MSNVVQLIEMMARNPRPLSAEEFVAAVANADLTPAVRQALLARDVDALSRELGGRHAMFCAVFPADNDEPKEDEQHDGDGEIPDSESTSRAA